MVEYKYVHWLDNVSLFDENIPLINVNCFAVCSCLIWVCVLCISKGKGINPACVAAIVTTSFNCAVVASLWVTVSISTLSTV